MAFLKIILLALVLPITAQQTPVKLVPKTVPAKPVQLKPITQPAKPQSGKSALITPATSAKTSQTQPQIPQPVQPAATPAKTPLSLKPRTAPAPAQKPAPKKEEVPAAPKEPFDLKKVIAERKALSKSKALPVVKSEYYTPENLQKLKSQGVPYHLPGILLLDQDNVECPTCGEMGMALTLKFAASLLEQKQIIICSVSLVHNLFYRLKYPSGSFANELDANKFDLSQWQIYDVFNSQFLLFIPNKYKTFFNEELWVNNNSKLANITDKFINVNSVDLNWLLIKKQYSPKFSADNFKNIFISKRSTENKVIPIWDFIIIGHGSYDLKMVGGLHHDDINKLLSFFDNEINTGVIALESCYSGGKNLELLQVSQSGIQLSHNYILIVCSSTDEVTYVFTQLVDFIKYHNQFFTNAAQMADKGESLNKIISDLQYLTFATGSPHGETSRIPQVWLPNGLGFQTFNINNDILSLGKLLIKAHEDEKKPIFISKKRAVLLYVNSIATPVIVEPTYITSSREYKTSEQGFIGFAKEAKWKNLAMPTDYHFWKDLNPDQRAQIAKQLKTDIPNELMVDIHWNTVRDLYIFPQFLLMRGMDYAYFKEIDVKNPSHCPACGILHFIRDAFFDVADNPITKTIYIDSLTGYNDLALILKAQQLKNEALGIKTSSEADDLIKNLNQIITLKNVRITISTGLFRKEPDLFFYFELYNKPWHFQANSDKWEITPYGNIEMYREIYDQSKKSTISHEKIDQKSISEVLKLKQQEILKKKATSKNAHTRHQRKTLLAWNKTRN